MSKKFLRIIFSLFFLCSGAIAAPGLLPKPDHIIVVFEENKKFSQIIGNMAAPYINTLANKGALFKHSYAITHPSQPNYLAFFSGSTQGVLDDNCPYSVQGDNLASQLIRGHYSFGIYSESLPSVGYTGCVYDIYFRKHNPVVNWQGINLGQNVNIPFTYFPKDFGSLPTVSIVVPNVLNDMHDGQPLDSIMKGDTWLKNHIGPYVKWASSHNSLLIVTWDEDDGTGDNHIATIFIGPMVKKGVYDNNITHYSTLRTIEDIYGLLPIGNSALSSPITNVWKSK